MNEYNEFCETIKYNSCRGCLKTNEFVHKANKSIVIKYQTLLSHCLTKFTDDLYLCIYCISIINKLTKFIQQCSEIDRKLNEFSDMVPVTYFNLTKHDIYSYSYMENDDKNDLCVKSEAVFDDMLDDRVSDDDDLPLVMFKSDEAIKEENNVIMEDIKLESLNDNLDKRKRKTKKYTEENNVITEDIKLESLDDNILKRKRKTKKYTSKKIRYKPEDELPDTKPDQDYNKQSVKKPLRAGFSSRMVQETDSYLVIKLSNKEVIHEMVERSKSDKYLRAPFKCEKCVKGFNFEDVLATHMEKHTTKNGTIICEICAQYCPNIISMRGHMKSHTTRYQCKICNVIRLSRQHLIEHYTNTHTGDSITYSCTECGYITLKRTAMQRHSRTHSTNQRYSCETCGKVFKNKESLRAHILRHESSQKYECAMCPRTFLYPSLLRAHQASVHTEQDHYCVECDVRFKSRENLKTHFKKSKAHRDPNSLIYKCQHCTSKFQTTSQLRHHVTSQHDTAVRPVRCYQCDKVYSTPDALKAHTRRVHRFEIAVKKHACHYCNLSFAQRAVLTKHIRVHTGERPFSCRECGLTFAQHATRHTHERLVHKKLPRSVKKSQELQQKNFQAETLSQQIIAQT